MISYNNNNIQTSTKHHHYSCMTLFESEKARPIDVETLSLVSWSEPNTSDVNKDFYMLKFAVCHSV